MSDVMIISDDSDDYDENSGSNLNIIIGTSDDSLSDENVPKQIIKKQMLIKNIFPKLKEKKPAINIKHESPSFLHEMMIRGVSVKMPVKPYGCQIALMSTVITAISKRENCILESPTGTGKTLALLCATLAWQQQEQNRIKQSQVQLSEQMRNGDTSMPSSDYSSPLKKFENLKTQTTPEKLFTKPVYGERSIYDPVQNADDTVDLNMKRKWEQTSPTEFKEPSLVTIHKKVNTGKLDTAQSSASLSIPSTSSNADMSSGETTQSKRTPTIYYGTRTHKQLEQVIKEFSRTHYCGQVKMTILSSREYSCIRPFNKSLWSSKDDMCRDCVKKQQTTKQEGEKAPSNCNYYENRAALNHSTLPPAFNLEQLVQLGEDIVACPYYAARLMAPKCEIVFCPYNYIIEPGIRQSMNINLNGNILIIDEAHNIEDVCREAATFIIHVDQIMAAHKEIDIASAYRYASRGADTYVEVCKAALDKWLYWFQNQRPLVEKEPVNNGKATFTWQDVKIFANTLDNHNIGRANYSEFSLNVQQLCRQYTDDPRSLIGISQSTCTLLETIDSILGNLFQNSGENMDDFVPVLFIKPSPMRKGQDIYGLHMLCLNPGVVFAGLRSARCICLASGTLAPRNALAAELGASFPHSVSPPHVVPPTQVWVGVVPSGPKGISLQLTWQGAQKSVVRDALGDTILRACRLTPHGVLCFMPSYRLMNDLQSRWLQTGLWKTLTETKYVYMESQNVGEHNDIMEEYYKSVDTEKGALLFAVFRGKAAEGMDFRDRQARLVIAVGIPYPSVEDPAVKEKRKYNDRYESRGLMRGAEWYAAQAYRALNQALGRCIRHRTDWGGALLLDERYARAHHTAHLPSWLKSQLNKNPLTYDGLVQDENSLQRFMEKMTLNDLEDI